MTATNALDLFNPCGERIAAGWKTALKDCPPHHLAQKWDVYAMIYFNGVVVGLQSKAYCNMEQGEELNTRLRQIAADIAAYQKAAP